MTAASVDLARGVNAGQTRTVATKAERPAWFASTHRLAGAVRDTCTHRGTRRVV
jgi:hypothetical protein